MNLFKSSIANQAFIRHLANKCTLHTMKTLFFQKCVMSDRVTKQLQL